MWCILWTGLTLNKRWRYMLQNRPKSVFCFFLLFSLFFFSIAYKISYVYKIVYWHLFYVKEISYCLTKMNIILIKIISNVKAQCPLPTFLLLISTKLSSLLLRNNSLLSNLANFFKSRNDILFLIFWIFSI